MRYLSIVLLCFIFINVASTQTAKERSVEVSAAVQETPAQINFSWPEDPSATFYNVYKKTLEAQTWGEPIAVLNGNDTSFVDTDIQVGEVFEYAFFKKEFDLVRDTFCIEPGTEVKFDISDMYGIGLCCNFNFGFYRLEACGVVVAEGSNFGFGTQDVFTVCNDGATCTEVMLTIAPDIFPNSTSWILSNNQTGEEIGTSGDVGDFIDERPKYGFITAGIKAPAIENRGQILLLVESNIMLALDNEIERLRNDLISEGWRVHIRDVDQNDAVTSVKSVILDVYNQNPGLNALFIIGHVPVPYSGDIYPDTHSENHQGAWSADPYYAELDGVWTDEVADITTAFFERNHNIPGDGKFDQDSIPTGTLELQHGRVDFYDMNFWDADEIELTRNYLDKDHAWRTGQITVQRRGLIDDNFNHQFAAPAASGWRNFAPMFGADNVDEVDYFSTMSNESYLWSYGCGSGSHVSSAGVGTSQDFANDSLLTVFTMLFGSQFGDWDNDNNFLKAPLATGLTLTNVWAGNPPWTFHQMALGQHIGFCAQATQNSNGLYIPGPQLVHTGLMGDPTLTMHPFRAPMAFEAFQIAQGDVMFSFQASPDPDVVGYYIYRGTNPDGGFERVSTNIVEDLSTFTDTPPYNGDFYYMLRAVKLETSGSGTYYNLSQGLIDTANFFVSVNELINSNEVTLSPNPNNGNFEIQFSSPIVNNWQLQVIDIQGRVVFQNEFGPGDAQIIQLDEQTAAGVYILRIQTQDGVLSKKIIID